ncbi:hypothetical protein [Labilibaculum euxinus]
MKRLSWTLVLPLTIVSLTIFTKWWYVLPVDAPDSMMYGFPIPYACNGWHTSLSYQIFMTEFLGNLLIHFTFWFIVVMLINRFLIKIRLNKIITIFLLTISGLFTSGLILIASDSNNIFKVKRQFDIEILKTGYKFVWDGYSRPENFDFDAYERNKEKERTPNNVYNS